MAMEDLWVCLSSCEFSAVNNQGAPLCGGYQAVGLEERASCPTLNSFVILFIPCAKQLERSERPTRLGQTIECDLHSTVS
jgi:hypothetical protein